MLCLSGSVGAESPPTTVPVSGHCGVLHVVDSHSSTTDTPYDLEYAYVLSHEVAGVLGSVLPQSHRFLAMCDQSVTVAPALRAILSWCMLPKAAGRVQMIGICVDKVLDGLLCAAAPR
jgi:hypothetical protein